MALPLGATLIGICYALYKIIKRDKSILYEKNQDIEKLKSEILNLEKKLANRNKELEEKKEWFHNSETGRVNDRNRIKTLNMKNEESKRTVKGLNVELSNKAEAEKRDRQAYEESAKKMSEEIIKLKQESEKGHIRADKTHARELKNVESENKRITKTLLQVQKEYEEYRQRIAKIDEALKIEFKKQKLPDTVDQSLLEKLNKIDDVIKLINSFKKYFPTRITYRNSTGDHHIFRWEITNKVKNSFVFTPDFKDYERRSLLNFINENYTTDSKILEIIDSLGT